MFVYPGHHKVAVAPEGAAAQQGVVVVQSVVVTVVPVVVVMVAGVTGRREAKGCGELDSHSDQSKTHRLL